MKGIMIALGIGWLSAGVFGLYRAFLPNEALAKHFLVLGLVSSVVGFWILYLARKW